MSYLEHHGVKGQKWGVRRFQNKDGTLTAAGRKRKQHLIEVGSGKRKRLVEAAKPFGSSGDYSRDVTGLNRRGIHGQVVNEDDNAHIIKKGTSIYRTAANSELNDDGTYGSLTKNDVDRYIDYGRSGELPGADKSNLNSMKIFEFSANRDLKIANGKYITEIITDDVKYKIKNGDADQVKLGKEILEAFKRHEEDLNISFSPSEMRRSKEAYSRTEAEKEFDLGLLDKANDRLALYDKKILDYASGKDYRVIRDRLKREGYDGFIDVEDVTTITNLVRGGANTEYPVVILNANDVLTLKRSAKESEIQRRLKRGTKFNSSRGELDNVVQHTSIGGTMYIEGNALILGDPSYLEHHGIRGQKWGVRRFQNADGSLTNAGRKRLGYATKSAAKTVSGAIGKSFKKGVKTGANLAKAAKQHHEEAEAKKLAAKKEKISKSRLAVLANKELFTNEEMKALNARFKIEDEMSLASIQKGAEIARNVGVIAKGLKDVVDVYESVSGTTLSPVKRAKAEAEAAEKKEDRERKIAKEDAEAKRAADKEQREIEDRDRRIKNEDTDRQRKQMFEDADERRKQASEKRNQEAEIRAQRKERRESRLAVETQRKAKFLADEQEHKAMKAKADAKSAILDVIKKANDMDGGGGGNNPPSTPPGGGTSNWSDSDWLKFFKSTGIIHDSLTGLNTLSHHGIRGQKWGVRRFQNSDGSLTESGTKQRKKKRAEYERMLQQSDFIIEDGTLYLSHHGIRGQKWGVRRFQNPDGTRTAAGKKRDARQMSRELNRLDRRQAKASRESASLAINRDLNQNWLRKLEYKKTVSDEKGNVHRSEKLQKKIDKGRANVERLDKMIKFADSDYKVSKKKVQSMLNTIDKSMDYAWKSYSVTRDDWLNSGGFSKDMRSKAGKPKLFEGTYFQWAKGNHYKVAYDKSGKKKRKWEATRGNRQSHTPIHVEYRDHYY